LPGRRVLVDTDILVSGLVFTKGNEHQVLQLAEDEKITLVTPEIVMVEAEEALREVCRFRAVVGDLLETA